MPNRNSAWLFREMWNLFRDAEGYVPPPDAEVLEAHAVACESVCAQELADGTVQAWRVKSFPPATHLPNPCAAVWLLFLAR